MKALFLFLLLANLALFAWQQGVFGRVPEAGREPERIARQIDAERVRIVSERDVKRLQEKAAETRPQAAAPIAAPAPATTFEPRPQVASAVDAGAPGLQACIEFGDFPSADVPRAQARLATLNLGDRLRSKSVDVPGWYRVYVPPLKSRPDVDKRVDELRKAGVKETLVLNDPPLRFAIVLGSFRDIDAARVQLAALQRAGVNDARVSDKPTLLSATRFEIRNIDTATAAQLTALRNVFPAQTLRACGAAA